MLGSLRQNGGAGGLTIVGCEKRECPCCDGGCWWRREWGDEGAGSSLAAISGRRQPPIGLPAPPCSCCQVWRLMSRRQNAKPHIRQRRVASRGTPARPSPAVLPLQSWANTGLRWGPGTQKSTKQRHHDCCPRRLRNDGSQRGRVGLCWASTTVATACTLFKPSDQRHHGRPLRQL